MVALKCCIGNKESATMEKEEKDLDVDEKTETNPPPMTAEASGDNKLPEQPDSGATTIEGTATTGKEEEGVSAQGLVNPDAAEAEGLVISSEGGGPADVKDESAADEPPAVEGDQVNVEVVDKDATAV